jgi:membrane protein DedA with SNARE-associated domain
MLQPLFDLFLTHPYAIIFVALFFSGESVLLPAVYYSLEGKLEPAYVFAVALLSTVISDIAWYYIGAHMKKHFFRRAVSGRTAAAVERLSGAFSHHGPLVLFLSKFVYGTRIAAQVLSGVYAMRFRTYLSVNVLGVSALIAALFILARFTEATVGGLEAGVHAAEIAFLVFVVLIVSGHLAFGSYIKKRWFR